MSEANLSDNNQVIEPSNPMAMRYPAKWPWFFVAICAAIPIITVINELPVFPGVIGAIGAIFCIFASRNALTVTVQVVLCSLITAGAWVIFVLYLGLYLEDLFGRIAQFS